MIFVLDYSIDELQRTPIGELHESVSELLRAHRLGYHLLVASRDVCAFLLSQLALSGPERATLGRIREQFTQTADLVRRSAWYISIRFHPANTILVAGSRIEISLDQVRRPQLLDRPAVVVEDTVSDGGFYDFVFHNLRDIEGVPPLSFEIFHGGGERSIAVLRSRIRDRRIACVVADKDVDSPLSRVPNKIRQMQVVGIEEGWPLSFVCFPPAKEIENLVPLDVLALLACAVERQNEIETLRRIEEYEIRGGVNRAEAFWHFFDVKRGLDAERLGRMTAEDRAWVEARMTSAALQPERRTMVGFGEQVIAQVLASNLACAKLRTSIRHPDWWNVFQDFVRDVIWICVGGNRQFT